MISEEAKEVAIDMIANGGLDWVLGEIAKNLEDIKEQLMLANQLKAEEMARDQVVPSDFSLDLVHELLEKHWSTRKVIYGDD